MLRKKLTEDIFGIVVEITIPKQLLVKGASMATVAANTSDDSGYTDTIEEEA